MKRALLAFAVGAFIYSAWDREDPRDVNRVSDIIHKRESASFHERLRRGDSQPWAWPGLSAAQVSWSWLELLYGLHKPESYEGDFSWIFSKINTILSVSRKDDINYVSSLAPFFFVIGHDGAGATLVMNELANRATVELWRPWFWGAFHAMENLENRRLAGDLLSRAARNPMTPPYFAALSLRLSRGNDFLDARDKGEILKRELDEDLLNKAREARPEWFGPHDN